MRNCQHCGTALNGRPHKKFCSSKCRVSAHRKKENHQVEDLVIIPVPPAKVPKQPPPVPYEILYRYMRIAMPFYFYMGKSSSVEYRHVDKVLLQIREIQEVKFMIHNYCKEHKLDFQQQTTFRLLLFFEIHLNEIVTKLEKDKRTVYEFYQYMKPPISQEEAIIAQMSI